MVLQRRKFVMRRSLYFRSILFEIFGQVLMYQFQLFYFLLKRNVLSICIMCISAVMCVIQSVFKVRTAVSGEQAKEEIYSFWSVLSGLQMYSIALSTVVLIPWIFVTAIFFPLTPLYRPDPFGKLHWCCLYDG